MPTQFDRAEAPVYPDDLLPQLQQTLGTLADLQLRYEIERDFLEDWSGPAEVKNSSRGRIEPVPRSQPRAPSIVLGEVAAGGQMFGARRSEANRPLTKI